MHCFVTKVLPTYQTRYVQFLLLKLCTYAPDFVSSFLDTLVRIVCAHRRATLERTNLR
jgi:hypothetical protein